MRALPWLLMLVFTGCFLSNTSPAKKISDTVRSLNENTRWGRIGDASLMVDGSYRNTFLSAHEEWGSKIEVADTEIAQIQIAPDEKNATAFVTYSWYSTETMTVHQTTVRQRWSAVGSGYALFSESIVKGDTRLLRTPQPAPQARPADTSKAPVLAD